MQIKSLYILYLIMMTYVFYIFIYQKYKLISCNIEMFIIIVVRILDLKHETMNLLQETTFVRMYSFT